jgi:hypothetical protein
VVVEAVVEAKENSYAQGLRCALSCPIFTPEHAMKTLKNLLLLSLVGLSLVQQPGARLD